MKVGLVRHFKVKCPPLQKEWLCRDDILDGVKIYDNSSAHRLKMNKNKFIWKRHYGSSPLLRASTTASNIFNRDWFVLKVLKREIKKISENNKKPDIDFFKIITVFKYFNYQ